MVETKSTTRTVRIQPAVKEDLCAMAGQERRSLANMIEVMILDYCGRNGIGMDASGESWGKGGLKKP